MIVQILSSDRIDCNLHESVTQAVLTPGRYVGIADVEDDGEPFEEKMERLTGELSELFAQSREAEDEIRKNLHVITEQSLKLPVGIIERLTSRQCLAKPEIAPYL